MNIETKWLKDFLSLANTRSFSRSAADRHVTQPAFSRRIKSLERALSCQLIDRTQTPIELTPQGKIFRTTARNMLDQLDETVRCLHGLGEEGDAPIDFATTHTLSLYLFPGFISRLAALDIYIQSRLKASDGGEAIRTLEEGDCDFLIAFDATELDPSQYPSLPLQAVTMVPVCRPDEQGEPQFPLREGRTTSVPYLGYSERAYLSYPVARLLQAPPFPVQLKRHFQSSMADSLKVMALEGHGVAWIPDFAIKRELQEQQLVECADPRWRVPMEVRIYRRSALLSPAAESLWRRLKSV